MSLINSIEYPDLDYSGSVSNEPGEPSGMGRDARPRTVCSSPSGEQPGRHGA